MARIKVGCNATQRKQSNAARIIDDKLDAALHQLAFQRRLVQSEQFGGYQFLITRTGRCQNRDKLRTVNRMIAPEECVAGIGIEQHESAETIGIIRS